MLHGQSNVPSSLAEIVIEGAMLDRLMVNVEGMSNKSGANRIENTGYIVQ